MNKCKDAVSMDQIKTAKTRNINTKLPNKPNNSKQYLNKFDAFELFDMGYSNIVALLKKYGWALKSETTNCILLTRPGKDIREGKSGILDKQTNIFTNFSSNTNLPVGSYNYYKLIEFYEFNGDAENTKQYVYDMCKNSKIVLPYRTQHQHYNNVKKQAQSEPQKRFSHKFHYRFIDPALEKQVNTHIENGMNRYDAEQKVYKENPSSQRERLYRVAINERVYNKNCNKKGLPHPNYYNLTFKFKNKLLTLNEIGEAVTSGFAQCFCLLKENENGEIHRKNESFIKCDLVAIDIDGGLSIEGFLNSQERKEASKHFGKAIALYTTYNHTNELNRYRVIFELPFVVEGAEGIIDITEEYISKYNADVSCSEPARVFYGANNGYFLNLVTMETINGKGGVQWEGRRAMEIELQNTTLASEGAKSCSIKFIDQQTDIPEAQNEQQEYSNNDIPVQNEKTKQRRFIQFFADITNNEFVAKSGDHYFIFFYILCNVTHNQYKMNFKGKPIILERGQMVTTIKEIAEKCRLKNSKVNSILKYFENNNFIDIEKINGGRLISVRCHDYYVKGKEDISETQYKSSTYENISIKK